MARRNSLRRWCPDLPSVHSLQDIRLQLRSRALVHEEDRPGHLFSNSNSHGLDFAELTRWARSWSICGLGQIVADALGGCPENSVAGHAVQMDAVALRTQRTCLLDRPALHNNVPYADLSDFFYVWLRRSLKRLPSLFATLVVPKRRNWSLLIPHGSKQKAKLLSRRHGTCDAPPRRAGAPGFRSRSTRLQAVGERWRGRHVEHRLDTFLARSWMLASRSPVPGRYARSGIPAAAAWQ